MRTTLTLDDDLFMALHERARATGRSFKDVVNEVVRGGLFEKDPPAPVQAPTLDLGVPRVDVTKALDMAMETSHEAESPR